MKKIFTLIAFLILTAGFGYPVGAADDGKGLPLLNTPDGIIRGPAGRDMYMKYCASCHHAERYGLKAPALIPETIKRYNKEELAKIITEGLPATQMPSFKRFLTGEDTEKIVDYITLPVNDARWDMEDIDKSREMFAPLEGSVNAAIIPSERFNPGEKGLITGFTETGTPKTAEGIDPENITLVVESGRGVTVMDGHSFKILDKFYAGAIHGGPKFSRSLKYVYAATRDGMVTKYDISTLRKIASVKAGINMRNIALSHDDRFLAAANYLPGNITILDADLNPKKIISAGNRIGGLYSLDNEKKFICSFRDSAEVWLIDYTDNFRVEKIATPEPFEDISISPFEDMIISSSRKGTRIIIYSLRERKIMGSFETDGMPHLASATYWVDKGVLYTAINHLKRPVVTILDLNNMKVVREINLKGSGFFVRTHQDTPFIWIDTNTDTIQIIDKSTLQVVKDLIPSTDKKAMHIEFTKDGQYAMVSIYEDEGSLVIYDAFKLKEVKRMPFKKPAGKYNALNKRYPVRQYTPVKISAAATGQ